MKNQFKIQGLILRKFDLNEADQILTILTKDHGKMSFLAKGIRRIKSRFCGKAELFYEVEIDAFQGKGICLVNEINLINSRSFFDSELETKSVLFYISEITQKLIQDDQHINGAYELLLETLDHLNGKKDNIVLHAYLIKLLTKLGFMSPWNHCCRCNKKLNLNETNFLNQSEISIMRSEYASPLDKPVKPSFIKWINFMQSYPLSEINKVKIENSEENEVWNLIQCGLRNILDRSLRSEEFLLIKN